jgi:CheY-like chemotaxis protein
VLAINAGVTVENGVSSKDLALVQADPQKLQQIVENLLTNALKFTPTGGTVRFDAEFAAIAPDDPRIIHAPGEDVNPSLARTLVVHVRDTGAGLREDQIARIWERFYQVDSTATRRAGGAGLGLAIVRSLVELHGGQVWARSGGPNKGSEFSFSLPLAPSTSRQRLKSGADRPTEAVLNYEPGDRVVLVAEDDADQREIICDMLELDGYKVVVASEGEEAYRLARELKPAMIALDVILPRMDGWEVLHRLRSDEATSSIPVLIISVVDQEEFGRKLGANEYLIKPLEPGRLRSAVRRLMPDETTDAGVTPS